MTLARQVMVALSFVLALTTSTGAQRWCTVPCGHPIHPYDIGPCQHPCYYPNGIFACHPAGDTYPCGHRVHPFDYIPC
jgi:hypothetical protein